ncbi:hypothetical protein ACIBP6_34590 [Nonomuraea terrae]|uniref:hypothetical protein n=1 Tax=Nonomuraea terrae TaxID=2530383 RepID=UPI0037A3307E
MPDFDVKLTRRAVRRGLFRTASVVLAVLLALALAATVGSSLVQTRGDREQRMTDVLGTAFKLYNPAYQVVVGACCATTPASMSFEVTAAPLRAATGPWAGGGAYTISQDLFGRVGRLPLGHTAGTRLSLALFDVGGALAPKDEVRKVLARLPDGLNALAVVEFAAPLAPDALKGFLEAYDTCADKVVYERRTSALPITWGTGTWDRGELAEGKEGCGVELGNLREWTGLLREHDDANLRRFDLSLDRLRTAARDGLAYAYVADLVAIEKLRRILEDPRVRTVRLADVAFDLDRP